MAWTTPRTWQTDEIVTAGMLNEQLRDNLNALKYPPTHAIMRDNGAAYSTTSTVFVPVDSTNLKATITTNGGDVLVWFWGVFAGDDVSRRVSLDLRVDGAGRLASDYAGGLLTHRLGTTTAVQIVLGPVLISGLSAGVHTFELLWKTNAGIIYLYSDSVATNDYAEVPAVLVAREVS